MWQIDVQRQVLLTLYAIREEYNDGRAAYIVTCVISMW